LDDAEEVFLEFLLCRRVLSVDDFDDRSVDAEDALEEFEGESAESITLRHDNSVDISRTRETQELPEALAAPVDPGSDVRDDFCVRVLVFEEVDLPLEVISLFWRRNTSIQNRRGLSNSVCVSVCSTRNGIDRFCTAAAAKAFNVIQPTT
jgi:hypothetical protein